MRLLIKNGVTVNEGVEAVRSIIIAEGRIAAVVPPSETPADNGFDRVVDA